MGFDDAMLLMEDPEEMSRDLTDAELRLKWERQQPGDGALSEYLSQTGHWE